MNNLIKLFLIPLLVLAQINFGFAQTTTASLLPNAVQQFFDNNGNPLTSGTVTFYLPNTTTLATTWKDSAETIPNTNPIKLDAGGKAIIYGNQTYSQLLKDRNGNIIWNALTAPGGGGGGTPTLIGDGEPVGTIKQWAGLIVPNQYAYAAGQQISRITFPELLAAITQQLNTACTTGSNVFTAISDTTQINIGSSVELICVAPGTTVVSKTTSSVTLSNPSSITLNAQATFFPFGDGDGSTTFTIPDLRGFVIAGRTNMGGTTSTNLTNQYYVISPSNVTPAALGAIGGSQNHTLITTELPIITPTGTISNTVVAGTVAGNGGSTLTPSGAVSVVINPVTVIVNSTFTGNSFGGGQSHSIVQPTITLNYIIKTTPDIPSSGVSGVASLGGMQGIIACGQGLNCSGNTISANGQIAGGANTNVQFNNAGLFAGSNKFNFISSSALLVLNNNAASAPTAVNGALYQAVQIDGTPSRYEADTFGASGFFTIIRANTSNVSKSALNANDLIGGFNWHGFGSTAYSLVQASIEGYASQSWTDTSHGTYIDIKTTLNNTITNSNLLRFENDGGITVPNTVSGGDKGTSTLNLNGLVYKSGNAYANSASLPLLLNATTGNLSITGSALTETNDTNVTLTLGGASTVALISPASITVGWSGQLAISRGGTGASSLTANQIVLGGSSALITLSCGTSTTVLHGGTPPTCSQIVFGDITTNTITNSNLSQIGAATFKGNPTASLANIQDFTIQGLTNLSSPSATLDFIPIYDHATGLIKNVTPGAIAGSVVAGVASVNALTGALTLNVNSGLNIISAGTTITITPDIATAANFEAGTSQKLLDANVVFSSETTTSFGTTTAFDFNTFINTKVTLTGNITTMNCSNMKASQGGVIRYIQDSTGSRTAAFNTGTCSSVLKFSGAVFPTLTTSASAVDVLSYNCSTSSYCAASLSKGYNP